VDKHVETLIRHRIGELANGDEPDLEEEFAALSHNLNRQLLQEAVFAMVDKYIEEAEHQDGPAFWLEFDCPEHLLEDFILFMSGSIFQGRTKPHDT